MMIKSSSCSFLFLLPSLLNSIQSSSCFSPTFLFIIFSVLKLLAPNHIDVNTIKNDEYLHLILAKGSFLHKCIEQGVVEIFGFSQISNLTDKLFWSIRNLAGVDYSSKKYMFGLLDDRRLTYKVRQIVLKYKHFFSPRYCAAMLFSFEVVSKLVMFLLVALIATQSKDGDND